MWHHFDVDAELGVANTVFDLKHLKWKGDALDQIRRAMPNWRTTQRRIKDPGDNSFVMCFKEVLGHSKIPACKWRSWNLTVPQTMGRTNAP